MYSITIDDKEFDLPENWSEITLQKFIDIDKLNKKDELYKASSMFNIEYTALMLNATIDDIYKLTPQEFNEITDMLGGFFNTEPDKTLIDDLSINSPDGKELKYKRRLNNKLLMEEVVTVENLIKANDNLDTYALILAILYRPLNDNGEIIELEDDMDQIIERTDLLKKYVTIDKLYGAMLFFSNGAERFSTKTSDHSSTLKVRKKVSS